MKLNNENKQIKSFDWQMALNQLNQNAELAKSLLSVFSDELPIELEKIHQAVENQDWYALRSIVHKLQGACVYCGVPRLRQHLQATEKVLLSEFSADELKKSIDTVEQEATTTLNEIKLFLTN